MCASRMLMIVGTLLAFATMLIVLFTGNPASSAAKLDTFALAISGVSNFVQTARDASVAAGVDLNPPFSLLATVVDRAHRVDVPAMGDL